METEERSNKVKVECYAGAFYPERPSYIVWRGVRCPVASIIGEWRTPDGHHFLVRAEDGRTFKLSYHESEDEWWLLEIGGDR